jgi:hypothetical protein
MSPLSVDQRDVHLIVLGLEPGRDYSAEEIRTAWQRRLVAVHPDHGGSVALAQCVTRAYEALMGIRHLPELWTPDEDPASPVSGACLSSNAGSSDTGWMLTETQWIQRTWTPVVRSASGDLRPAPPSWPPPDRPWTQSEWTQRAAESEPRRRAHVGSTLIWSAVLVFGSWAMGDESNHLEQHLWVYGLSLASVLGVVRYLATRPPRPRAVVAAALLFMAQPLAAAYLLACVPAMIGSLAGGGSGRRRHRVAHPPGGP